MRIDADCLVDGEAVGCSFCTKPIVMSLQRKIKRKMALADSKEWRMFCDPTCNTDFYNAKKKAERVRG